MNMLQQEDICRECEDKTRIAYKFKDGFFTPRLRGINHLEVGYSRIISNPVTILIELAYVAWKWLRRKMKKLNSYLFPRRGTLYAGKNDSFITGRVVHAGTRERQTPVHNLKVVFWGRTWWLQWRRLGEACTNREGVFRMPYTLRCARNWKVRSLQLEFNRPYKIGYHGDTPHVMDKLYHVLRIPPSDLIGMGFNVHAIQLPFWEYRPYSKVPRAFFSNIAADNSETYEQARIDAFAQQVIPIELTKRKHMLQIARAPETISIRMIQDDYPENLTVCIEKKQPGYTRGDKFFGQRMMNGMNRGSFLPDGSHPGEYVIKYFGICNYEYNDEYALPTSVTRFRLDEKGLPLPVEITLTGPLNAIDKNPWQRHVFTPETGEHWMAAKRIVRTTGAVCTEVDEHFTATHVNTEQYAIAAFRNLRLNPVACLLFPHLKEASLINHAADKLIIGGYLPTATALTRHGLENRIGDIMGMLDWCGWTPMKPISNAHHYALAENLFWNLVTDFVDHFFASSLEGIKEHWYEIYAFSNDLVSHSVPVYLSDTDVKKLKPEERQLCEERFAYYAFQYTFHPSMPRETINGQLKTISPITKTTEFVQQEDIRRLKDACKYAIMTATFMHTWINEHQYDDLGEILYNCGGLRFGENKLGVLAPESDLRIAPDLTRSTQMLWFANLLARTEYGFITENEDGDVHPYLVKLMKDHTAEFKRLGVDITAIESRTNI